MEPKTTACIHVHWSLRATLCNECFSPRFAQVYSISFSVFFFRAPHLSRGEVDNSKKFDYHQFGINRITQTPQHSDKIGRMYRAWRRPIMECAQNEDKHFQIVGTFDPAHYATERPWSMAWTIVALLKWMAPKNCSKDQQTGECLVGKTLGMNFAHICCEIHLAEIAWPHTWFKKLDH